MSRTVRLAMVDRDHGALSVVRQCGLLGLSRSSVYYRPASASPEALALMRLIDEQYLATPFYGSRRMTAWLRARGQAINRKRVRRLMAIMGLSAIYQKPRTSQPQPDNRIYPYLLRNLRIDRADQVWCSDLSYIPMARGFLYLVVVMDWFSRAVLAWRLSNTMETASCLAALEEALADHGPPEIFNTDQGSQFTSSAWVERVEAAGAKVSMDGKGRFLDNIFVERLWRSLKYEEVYLHAYESVAEARAGIGRWIDFYNAERYHQALDYRTPMAVYEDRQRPVDMMDNADALTTYPQAQQQPKIDSLM